MVQILPTNFTLCLYIDIVLIFFPPGIDVTLDAMPNNGIILVFTGHGSHQLDLENAIKEKSRKKNVKILFAILTSRGEIDTGSLEVYESLSHGELFYSTEDGYDMVNIKAFFEAVVKAVRKFLLQ